MHPIPSSRAGSSNIFSILLVITALAVLAIVVVKVSDMLANPKAPMPSLQTAEDVVIQPLAYRNHLYLAFYYRNNQSRISVLHDPDCPHNIIEP